MCNIPMYIIDTLYSCACTVSATCRITPTVYCCNKRVNICMRLVFVCEGACSGTSREGLSHSARETHGSKLSYVFTVFGHFVTAAIRKSFFHRVASHCVNCP